MANYQTTVTTSWDPEAAFAYLARFDNIAEWDPGVESAESLSDDPLSSGARFALDFRFLGRTVPLTYETVSVDAPNEVVLRADAGSMISLDTLTFEPHDGGTAVTYDAELTLKGPLKLLDPALKLVFNRLGDAASDGLAERLAGPPPEEARAGDEGASTGA